MDDATLERLLRRVQRGKTSVGDALSKLRDLPFVELGYATVDTHRSLRMGIPEVVFGARKTVDQLIGIIETLRSRRQAVLVTRIVPEVAVALQARFPTGRYVEIARIFHLPQGKPRAGVVAIVSAGTSDLPVAEEAAVTAESLGAEVRRVYDVG